MIRTLASRAALASIVTVAFIACGPSTSSTLATGPVTAREGASSGAMSRSEVSFDPATPITYPSPGSVPVRSTANSDLGGDDVRAGAASNPQPIALGQTITGRLQQSDTPLADGSVGDDYFLVVPAGAHLHIELHGGEITGQPGSHMDMYLHLLHDGREIARDDDGGGNLDSLIDTTVADGGAYIIRATTYGTGLREGAYTLVTRAGP